MRFYANYCSNFLVLEFNYWIDVDENINEMYF